MFRLHLQPSTEKDVSKMQKLTNERLRYLNYITEGNVIFLNGYARLTDEEVVRLYNVTVELLSVRYPEMLTTGGAVFNRDEETLKLFDELNTVWKEIAKRRIRYLPVKEVFLEIDYTNKEESVQ